MAIRNGWASSAFCHDATLPFHDGAGSSHDTVSGHTGRFAEYSTVEATPAAFARDFKSALSFASWVYSMISCRLNRSATGANNSPHARSRILASAFNNDCSVVGLISINGTIFNSYAASRYCRSENTVSPLNGPLSIVRPRNRSAPVDHHNALTSFLSPLR